MTTPATTLPEQGKQLSDLDLYAMAEDFLDALLSAADVDTVGMTRWWERAKTALETAAASADSWRQCVARAARKLQVEAPDERLSKTVSALAKHLDDPDTYRRWARLAERDALSITAMVRERRTSRRPKKAEPKTTETDRNKTEEPECLPF